jgi:hypothetical protein
MSWRGFGGQGKQGAEEVERLTASLADEQASTQGVRRRV